MLVEKHKNFRRMRNLRDFEKLHVIGIVDVDTAGRELPASPTIAFIE